MTSVIRQEWKRRSSNTYTVAIVLAVANLLAMALYYFDGGKGALLPFLPNWVIGDLLVPIVIIMDTFGFFLGMLFDNASVMKDMLFKDNGYLMKLLPVNSWKLIGGKTITGLLELLFFGVQCFIYLVIFALIESEGSFEVNLGGMPRRYLAECICMALFAMIALWLFVNMLLNLARTVTSVITKRWKVPKVVVLVVFFLVIWLTLKLTFEPVGNFIEAVVDYTESAMGNLTEYTANIMFRKGMNMGWLVFGILTAISGVYYAITCVLYEKLVEV